MRCSPHSWQVRRIITWPNGIPSYFIVGNAIEFPDRSKIPIDLVRRAVKEFLASGGQRPTCVQWQVPES